MPNVYLKKLSATGVAPDHGKSLSPAGKGATKATPIKTATDKTPFLLKLLERWQVEREIQKVGGTQALSSLEAEVIPKISPIKVDLQGLNVNIPTISISLDDVTVQTPSSTVAGRASFSVLPKKPLNAPDIRYCQGLGDLPKLSTGRASTTLTLQTGISLGKTTMSFAWLKDLIRDQAREMEMRILEDSAMYNAGYKHIVEQLSLAFGRLVS
ncbi:hypothetical protein A2526_02430 [candidate division WOR-1 bacterium RIFOXYD2_FULL_36_8]|uniref:Uncharacterized protein n=1 Tax=candidate division WOR-1 bacterium RIFOXYB2_FULL_36_35 TaxID=1802578 RepID=A0A1F4S4A1_UNCSA|nr:MAG: hypothetical protein A2230_00975 [candidate division WOR-1 bacterium RIFOXYA2_FULL_36_21]OGC14253.1 MAG: hypothetical protein A2282_06690 [candidate division WOR-1 bacterium RIFOXYA12_FULL_36_13]OGC15258.1 MAG: hypothetical protein A2290_03185 [candidate division WOR-1 bacterium RIFOXYB2_FULL_36_35]OGC37822.1 MAG: hypothetical protein A2526_02430 [candidate division WOR-1 bacterium RIFOXYD2_FULL_36_8]